MKTLLIKNGTVATATDLYQADVYVVGETVHTIGTNLPMSADQVLDATGCYLLPGGIDPHTHMQIPFMGTYSSDTFETGTLAALHGGTTTIIDFAIQTRGDTLNNAVNQWMEWAHGSAVGDFSFHVAVTDLNPQTKAEVQDLIHKRGLNSFKVFMAYKGALMIDDGQICALMRELKQHGGLLTVHAENGDQADQLIAYHLANGKTAPQYHCESRPARCEAEATGRIIDLASSGDHGLYIVHMTCKESLDRVRAATLRNQKVFAETCIQYLLLDDSLYYQAGMEGAKWVMSPPLRKPADQEALWAGINQRLVRVVATDHCPFLWEQKQMGKESFAKIPNGHPAVEHRMELLWSEGVDKGRITVNQFVDVTATAAAKIFGLFPRKGTIAVGSDADIVLWDPKARHTISAKTHHMNVDYSAYEGWQVTGKARATILRGTVAINEGKALVGKGFGQFLARSTFDSRA